MPGAYNFIKKETLAQVFSCEFSKISRNTFFTEYLWASTSVWLCIVACLKCFTMKGL